MQLGNGTDQAEAETVAWRRAAPLSPIEAVLEARQVDCRDAGAVILDGKKHTCLRAAVSRTKMRVPDGVWRSEFSTRLARAWVSSSRSPLTVTSCEIVEVSR